MNHFIKLGLPEFLAKVVEELGYETPTPVQAQSIPILMQGKDLLAQAQTGTGKTAAFALPALSNLEINVNAPQVLVIAPTRELAIQVAEAFQSYAKGLKGFHVMPIYGGQDYRTQLRALKRGTHVIVGTPGRVMDHLRRGSLALDEIRTVVLDEADEMLKMGFIDDIKWILEQIPHEHQTALFSATMAPSIQQIAKRYLYEPEKVHIKPNKNAVASIEQCYIRATGNKQKLDVLTRLLEVEDVQAAIIFTRTKNSSDEIAEKLLARGYAAAALNGNMNQRVREKVIGQIKSSKLDIIVATDVAARGIDVDRISHVINYDIPHDTESYIHRIGRTGRAGRQGKACLFVASRENRLLKDIERAIGKSIQEVEAPSSQQMKEKRAQQLTEKVMKLLGKTSRLKAYRETIENIIEQSHADPVDIAAALACLMQKANPVPTHDIVAPEPEREPRGGRRGERRGGDRRRSDNGGRRSSNNRRRDDDERSSRSSRFKRKGNASGHAEYAKKKRSGGDAFETLGKRKPKTKVKTKLKLKKKSKVKTKGKSAKPPKGRARRK